MFNLQSAELALDLARLATEDLCGGLLGLDLVLVGLPLLKEHPPQGRVLRHGLLVAHRATHRAAHWCSVSVDGGGVQGISSGQYGMS